MLKLILATVRSNKLHAAITFLCITLSAVLFSAVCVFLSTFLSWVDKESGSYATLLGLCTVLLVIVASVSIVIIRSVFTVGFNERVNVLGLFATIGMTNREIALLVLCESVFYGIFGAALGTFLGYWFSELCVDIANDVIWEYGKTNPYYAGVYLPELTIELVPDIKLLAMPFFVSFTSAVLAAVKPMRRAGKLSIIDSLKADVRINVSLREGFFERIFNDRYGRMGRLACQNFDNHGPRYRAVSMSMSCSAILFITIYSMFMWGLWEDKIYSPFDEPAMIVVMALGFALTFISLVGAASSAITNINSRKREFAVFKSLGMSNSDMLKMMCFESVLMVAHAAVFSLLMSLASVTAQYVILFVNLEVTRFHFPITVWFVFLVIDIGFAFFFAVYSVYKIKRINIAAIIK